MKTKSTGQSKRGDAAAFAIGVDLGGTNLRAAAVDETGRLLEKISEDTGAERPRDQVIAHICRCIQALLESRKGGGKLLGVGVGVPGIIDLESGMLRGSPNLPGWDDYPVREEIERRLGARVGVILENDANVAALGEKWLGAGRAVDSLCMLTLGTGVGGGVVLQGRIWHGMTGMAGELGHTTVDPEGPPCGCGSRGCVEQFASATAIERMAQEAMASGEAKELARAARENPNFSAETVHRLAQGGDAAAREIFARAGRGLGIAVAALINIFNLPMYVIGGGVAKAWEVFSPAMLEEVRARSFVYRATAAGKHATVITRAQLGSDAGLFGAARLAMVPFEVHKHEHARKTSPR